MTIHVIEVKLKVDKHSSAAVTRKFRDLTKAVKDTKSANIQVARWLLRWVNDNFVSEGGKVGGWAPFKAGGRWIRQKGKKPYLDTNAKLLQHTGHLRLKFHSFATKTSAGIGNNQPYSIYHELGLPTGKLPARRMLPNETDDDVSDAVIKIYDWHMERAIRR